MSSGVEIGQARSGLTRKLAVSSVAIACTLAACVTEGPREDSDGGVNPGRLVDGGTQTPADPPLGSRDGGGLDPDGTGGRDSGPGAATDGGPTGPPPGCATAGSDGPDADAEGQSFTDGRGRTSEYHIYPGGAESVQSPGLLVYLHGDGAYSYRNPGSLNDIKAIAEAHHLVMLVPRAPPDSSNSWWQRDETNGQWLRALIEQVAFGGYNIDRSRILLMGFSGGADFTSLYFVPDHWDILPCGGGALIQGGGGAPWSRSNPFSPDFVRAFKLHFYTGLDDDDSPRNCNPDYDALSNSREGAERYRGLGFTVTAEHPPGIDHCNVDEAMVLTEQLENELIRRP